MRTARFLLLSILLASGVAIIFNSCQPSGPPELPEELAAKLIPSGNAGVYIQSFSVVPTDPTPPPEPPEPPENQDLNCSSSCPTPVWVVYNVLVCIPFQQDDILLGSTVSTEPVSSPKADYRYTSNEGTLLNCFVHGGPWAGVLTRHIDCNLVESYDLGFAHHPPVGWYGKITDIPIEADVIHGDFFNCTLTPCSSLSDCGGPGEDPELPDDPSDDGGGGHHQ